MIIVAFRSFLVFGARIPRILGIARAWSSPSLLRILAATFPYRYFGISPPPDPP